MSNRHLARTIALQSLFEWDFRGQHEDLGSLLERNQREFAPDFEDNGFTSRLVKGVRHHLDGINQLIVTYAPEWPLDQITACDRNVLRIGIYELKYDAEVPPRVAINEAIELAKTFGGESSGKFVNGVLGSLYKDMEAHGEKISTTGASSGVDSADEPGADVLVSQPQASEAPVLAEINSHTGRVEVSAGGVVYRRIGADDYRFALIKDGYGKWTFPKGHIEAGESTEIAALEEIKEETGLRDLEIKNFLGTNMLTVNIPDGATFKKPVHYYLVETTDVQLRAHITGEVQEAGWFSALEALSAIGYEDAKRMFKKALQLLAISL